MGVAVARLGLADGGKKANKPTDEPKREVTRAQGVGQLSNEDKDSGLRGPALPRPGAFECGHLGWSMELASGCPRRGPVHELATYPPGGGCHLLENPDAKNSHS
ncbi:hypothetical protein Salat_1110400 [Sesamum alatum]|uniref:Uncharacterized protein n=1 Tax=Sesamum alatum TaxID=300844 RepID=A0AAE1YNF8_9LAMI|nr:hypothetical protein Salat_1110400 [Sesamum alatum]